MIYGQNSTISKKKRRTVKKEQKNSKNSILKIRIHTTILFKALEKKLNRLSQETKSTEKSCTQI